MDQGIAAVADQLMASDPVLRPKYTRAEWTAEVRKAFGPVWSRNEPSGVLCQAM
jgi:hypothetical protein